MVKQESHRRWRSRCVARQIVRRPRPRCRSRSGRPSCSCRRSGSAPPHRPSADARGSRSSSSRTSSERIVPPHVAGGPRDDGLGRQRGLPRSAARCGTLGEHRGARSLPTSDQESCSSPMQLGEREIEAGLGLRAGVHRDAEAGAARLAAVHRDDERALAPRLVVRIDVRRRPERPGPEWRSRAARRSARR